MSDPRRKGQAPPGLPFDDSPGAPKRPEPASPPASPEPSPSPAPPSGPAASPVPAPGLASPPAFPPDTGTCAPGPRALVLRRDLVVLDTETTGNVAATDRIVELAMLRLSPGGARRSWCRRLDPGLPIPPEATDIHGIRDEDVKGCPFFAQVAAEVREFLDGADLAGFNVHGFDLPLLQAEFARAGTPWTPGDAAILDAMTVFHRKERRDLSAAVRLYLGRDHAGAHGAMADVEAALEVLAAQLLRYPDVPSTVPELHGWCAVAPGTLTRKGQLAWKGDEAVFTFGKHKGAALREVLRKDRSWLEWVADPKQSFDEDLVAIVRDALAGRLPARPPAGSG